MEKSKNVIHWLDRLAIHRRLVSDKVADLLAQYDELKKRFDELVNDEAHFKENSSKRQALHDKMVVLERDIEPFLPWLEESNILLSDNIYMNRQLYSDINPYEVVEMITPRKFVIREMITVETEESRQRRIESFVPGGFCGHTNNDVQDWDIFPNDNPDTQINVIVRKHKDGYWYDTYGNRYRLSSVPEKFYDFNF